MNLLNLTLTAHRKALAQNRVTPAERRDLDSYPMRWHDDDGQMVAVFDETRLTERQEADVREILERMAGSGQKKDVKLLVHAHMEAFGRFGLRVDDIAAALSVDKKTALKHLRNFAEDGLVEIREEKTRGSKGSLRKRYFWTKNQAEYGAEDAFTGLGDDSDAPGQANLHVQRDRSQGGRSQSDFGTGIVHHGASAHAPQCPDRCIACRASIDTSIWAEARSAARQAGGTGFSVGLAERIAAREAAEATIFSRMTVPPGVSPARRTEIESGNRDRARNLARITL